MGTDLFPVKNVFNTIIIDHIWEDPEHFQNSDIFLFFECHFLERPRRSFLRNIFFFSFLKKDNVFLFTFIYFTLYIDAAVYRDNVDNIFIYALINIVFVNTNQIFLKRYFLSSQTAFNISHLNASGC